MSASRRPEDVAAAQRRGGELEADGRDHAPVLERQPRRGQAAADQGQNGERLGEFSGPRRPGRRAASSGASPASARRPTWIVPSRVAHGGRPVRRPVDQQPIAERHPAKEGALPLPLRSPSGTTLGESPSGVRRYKPRQPTTALRRGRRVPCVPLMSGRRPPVQASGRCRLSLAQLGKPTSKHRQWRSCGGYFPAKPLKSIICGVSWTLELPEPPQKQSQAAQLQPGVSRLRACGAAPRGGG